MTVQPLSHYHRHKPVTAVAMATTVPAHNPQGPPSPAEDFPTPKPRFILVSEIFDWGWAWRTLEMADRNRYNKPCNFL